jgi:hypothetical protein
MILTASVVPKGAAQEKIREWQLVVLEGWMRMTSMKRTCLPY